MCWMIDLGESIKEWQASVSDSICGGDYEHHTCII